MALHFITEAAALTVGEMKSYEVGEERVLLFHLDDGFYATQTKCTHLFMPLEKGKIVDKCRVQCKFHHAQFDIRTGKVCEWANFPPGIQALNFIRGKKDLKTYVTKVTEGKVFVEI
ncbi:MAG: dioxygenase ferredoxin subunit [Halothiobacillaceae bacterium]|nr:MAG: dioxygenase ferredoxin subunit [Halothiobacillaceae bacterium]